MQEEKKMSEKIKNLGGNVRSTPSVSTMRKIQEVVEKKKVYIMDAIDYENGKGFHNNVNQKSSYCFFSENSFCVFKVVNVENVNCCYIKYIYGQDRDTLKSVFLGMLNYIINRNVKFIYYSRKRTDTRYYGEFFEKYGFKHQTQKSSFKYNFNCKQCENDKDKGEKCECETDVYFI